MVAFRDYFAKNLKYPEEAVKKGLEGTVYVSYTIRYKRKSSGGAA